VELLPGLELTIAQRNLYVGKHASVQELLAQVEAQMHAPK